MKSKRLVLVMFLGLIIICLLASSVSAGGESRVFLPLLQASVNQGPTATPTVSLLYQEGDCGEKVLQNWASSTVTVPVTGSQSFWTSSDWATVKTDKDQEVIPENSRAITVSAYTTEFSGFTQVPGENAPIFGCYFTGNFQTKQEDLLKDLAEPVWLIEIDASGNITSSLIKGIYTPTPTATTTAEATETRVIPTNVTPTATDTPTPTPTPTLVEYQENYCGPEESGGIISGWYTTASTAAPTILLPADPTKYPGGPWIQTWVTLDSGVLVTSKGQYPIPANTHVVVISSTTVSYLGVGTNGTHANLWACAANMQVPDSRVAELVNEQSNGGTATVVVWDVAENGSVSERSN